MPAINDYKNGYNWPENNKMTGTVGCVTLFKISFFYF